VLPPEVTARVAVEAASPMGWERWVGDRGEVVGISHFGASAPAKTVFHELGFSVENVCERARAALGERSSGPSRAESAPGPTRLGHDEGRRAGEEGEEAALSTNQRGGNHG
jgi:transketolase